MRSSIQQRRARAFRDGSRSLKLSKTDTHNVGVALSEVRDVIFMFIVTAPLNRGVEVTKTFLKAVETPPPSYLRSRGVYTTYGDEGYVWYNIVEIDDKHVAEGLTEVMKRTVPFDGIEGLRIKMKILTPMRTAVEVVYPNRITTGYKSLDDVLFGGIPQKYAVILTSPPCDERDLLIKRFLEVGAKNEEATFYVTIDPGEEKPLTEQSSNFYLFVCNPRADTLIEDLPNVFKMKGVENLTEISIALTKALGTECIRSMTGPKRACIEITSDVLLQHRAIKVLLFWR